MTTLFPSYRVSDLERSMEFCSRLGYRCLGRIALHDGSTLAMLLSSQETAVSLELVHRPGDGPAGRAASTTSPSRSTTSRRLSRA